MAIRVTDLKFDVKSLGDTFLLADVQPSYEYKDKVKTNNINGYKYYVALPSLKMEKLAVKVLGHTPIVDLENIPVMKEVEFVNLEVGSYFMNGQINVNAKADSVSLK